MTNEEQVQLTGVEDPERSLWAAVIKRAWEDATAPLGKAEKNKKKYKYFRLTALGFFDSAHCAQLCDFLNIAVAPVRDRLNVVMLERVKQREQMLRAQRIASKRAQKARLQSTETAYAA